MGRRSNFRLLPSQAELLRLFVYDPTTGKLTWRVRPHSQAKRSAPDTEAGTVKAGRGNYLVVGIGRVYFYAHRIIWKMVTGDDPVDQIDHIDGNRLNNRWDNLRPATNGSNIWNSKLRADNKSGVKGVHWDTGHRAWNATIGVNKKQIKLGRFKNLANARAARLVAQERLHGDFARAE